MSVIFDCLQLFAMAYPKIGPCIFIISQIFLAIFFLPCSPLTLMAGILWGAYFGLGLSIVGTLASSSITFLVSRYLFRSKAKSILYQKFPSLFVFLQHIKRHDWKVMAILQLNPLIPASSLGYFFGISPITLSRYIALTFIFNLPFQILYAITGESISNFINYGSKPILVFLLVLCLFLLIFLSPRIFNNRSQALGLSNES